MVVKYLEQQSSGMNPNTESFEECATSETAKTAKTLRIEPVAILVFRDQRDSLKQQIEKLLIRMYGLDSFPVLGLFDGKDCVDLRAFKNKIGEYFTCFCLDITPKGFVQFNEILHANAEQKTVYSCGGRQFDYFIYKNAIVTLDSGVVNFVPKLVESEDYDDIRNSLIDLDNSCRPELAKTEKEPITIAGEFFTNLVECYSSPEAFICFGAALATCFWDLFRDFPVILFLGETQSGKSTLMYCLSSIFGLDDNSVMSGTSTAYAITKELGGRLNIPLFIEELTLEFFKKQAETMVKSVFSAVPRERGRKTGIEKLPIFTTFVASSNYSFIDPSEALLSRCLFVQMKKDHFNKNNFKYFDETSRKKLSVILPLFFKNRNYFIPLCEAVTKQLEAMIKHSGNRYLKSVAISCSMWILVNKILGEELFDWKKMAIEYCASYEKYLCSRVTDSDFMLRNISKLIDDDVLKYGVHYQLIHDVILRLNLKKFVEIFNMKLAYSPEQLLTPQRFCFLVSGDKRFDTKRTKMKTIGRAISINIAEEENLLAIVRARQPYGWKYEDESEE